MGIRGLTSYLNPIKNTNIKNCAIKIENLSSEIKKGLAIDGNALVYHLIFEYGLQLSIAINGGSYLKFEIAAEQWLSKLIAKSQHPLLIITDGIGEPQKEETHRLRHIQRNNKVCGMIQALENDINPNLDDFSTRMNIGIYIACLKYICNKLKIEFYACEKEADLQIAKFTLEKNFFACLSSDSDFFCLQAPYIPLNSIVFHSDRISADLYTAESIIGTLGFTSILFLPHLACLIGNDYISQDDKKEIHSILNIPSNDKNTLENIVEVIKFLTQTEKVLEVINTKLSNCKKYQDALLQYDISIVHMEQEQLFLFGLSLKLYAYNKSEKKLPFRVTLTANPFFLYSNMKLPEEPQMRVSLAFKNLRSRIYDVSLGPNILIEEETISFNSNSIDKWKTKKIEIVDDLNQFLWIIGERSFKEPDIANLRLQYKECILFGILTIRALNRIDPLTKNEKLAILNHLLFRTNATSNNNIKQSKMKRTMHIVSAYEMCLCLCFDAHIASNYCFGQNIFDIPSLLIDGERLSYELQQNHEHIESLVALLDDSASNSYCRFEAACRWIKCPLLHPLNVWGRCSFDGICGKELCSMRHLLQDGPIVNICHFDGQCKLYATKCKFRHVKQTQVFIGIELDEICRFDGACNRFPLCSFRHIKTKA